MPNKLISRVMVCIIISLCLGVMPEKNDLLSKDYKWGKELQGCSLGSTSEKLTCKGGEPVDIWVIFKNDGKSDKFIALNYQSFDCELKALDAKGQRVPLTRNGEQKLKDLEFSMLHIKPGENIRRQYRLNQIFDLSVPGDYRVTVSLKFGDDGVNTFTANFDLSIKIEDDGINY